MCAGVSRTLIRGRAQVALRTRLGGEAARAAADQVVEAVAVDAVLDEQVVARGAQVAVGQDDHPGDAAVACRESGL